MCFCSEVSVIDIRIENVGQRTVEIVTLALKIIYLHLSSY